MTRGFVIMAQNTEKVDYVKCAKVLAQSIKQVMPNANVTIITDLPYPKQEGYANDWQVYYASPYDETIKLEADMIIPRSIEHWWEILSVQDVVVCSTIRNFKGEISDVRAYRKFIDENNLPDCYNAITYFKKSEFAKQFFDIVRNVFENWEEYKAILKCNPQEEASTDWVYAIACHILGNEKTSIPNFSEFSMTHMKQFINGMPSEDWANTLVCEFLPDSIRVNTYTQSYPFHYHVKEFSDTIAEGYQWKTM